MAATSLTVRVHIHFSAVAPLMENAEMRFLESLVSGRSDWQGYQVLYNLKDLDKVVP